MMQLPHVDADIVIRVPLPHADVSEEDLGKIRSEFHRANARVSLRAEEVYPVSASWAEIAVVGTSFLAGAAASHYAEKCFDALDRFLKKRFDRINLGISIWDRIVYRDIPRDNRAEAIALIREALDELEKGGPPPKA